jgi:hypothetical protein
MFKRDRLLFVGVGLAVVIATFLALRFAPNSPSALEQEQRSGQENYCAEYKANTVYNPDGTATTVSEGRAHACDKEQAADQRANLRQGFSIAEADLLAQQQMAYWTSWMGIFASFSLVALVWTLFETRRLAQAQSAAFLNMAKGEAYKAHTGQWVLKLTIVNQGDTPAKNIQVTAHLDYFDGEVDGPPIIGHKQKLVSRTLTYMGPKSDDLLTLLAEPIFPAENLYPDGPRGDISLRTDRFGTGNTARLRLNGTINFTDTFGNKESVPIAAEVILLWERQSATFYQRAIDWDRQVEAHKQNRKK